MTSQPPRVSGALSLRYRLARIKLTANLQHPHILPLFDSGEVLVEHPERSEGPRSLLYYVMPFVEGESLRDRLRCEKQLPVDDAVRIAREVADATLASTTWRTELRDRLAAYRK